LIRIYLRLASYAGSDGEFSAWMHGFLNGKEWGAVLDAYHSPRILDIVQLKTKNLCLQNILIS
jgi:hypothetical protein